MCVCVNASVILQNGVCLPMDEIHALRNKRTVNKMSQSIDDLLDVVDTFICVRNIFKNISLNAISRFQCDFSANWLEHVLSTRARGAVQPRRRRQYFAVGVVVGGGWGVLVQRVHVDS